MRKLGQVCQERAYDRQNCFRQVVADKHNNNNKINKIFGHLVRNDQITLKHNYSNNNHFYRRKRTEQK